MHAYILPIDRVTRRVALNLKDCTMDSSYHHFEGLFSLFGGKVEPGEAVYDAAVREIAEEIPGFLDTAGGVSLRLATQNIAFSLYVVETDLSGGRDDRATSRVGELARCCQEGDGIVRTFDWVWSSPRSAWTSSMILNAILDVIREM